MAPASRKGSRGSRGSTGPRGTLGTLLRTTLAQAGVVREVLERGAREGRARLDDARRGRRRDQALIRLGEAVLEAVRAGEAQDLFDLPEVADALAEIDGLDAGAEEPPERGVDVDVDDEDAPGRARGRERSVWVPPGIRDQFDRRPQRPPPIEPAEAPSRDDDGTVSAVSSRARARKPADEPGARFAERPPARRGGIQFTRDDDDDEDLSQYMHPDDVPPKKE